MKKSLKLNLGCGNDIKKGYINIDKHNNLSEADLCCDISQLPYEEGTVDEILLFHILEHFPFRKVPIVLKEWRRVLKLEGIIKIKVPNLEQWIDKWNSFSDDDKFNRLGLIFGDENHEGNFHYSGFTEGSLKYVMEDNGFKIIESTVGYAFGGNVLKEISIVAKKVPLKENKIENVLVNFLEGARVEILGRGDLVYEIDCIDQDSKSSVHSDFLKLNHWTITNRKYYTNWLIKVSCMGEVVFEYKMDLFNKRILISFESKSLGDNIAWMPYVEEFRKKYNCKVILSTFWNSLFEKEYLEIEYICPGQVVHDLFAHYCIGCWDNNFHRNKQDWRITPIQKIASDILGLEYKEIIPKISIPEKEKNIDGKYVCIGIHSTAQCKYWNYPGGWQVITDYLNKKGYKVVHISKEQGEYMRNYPPKNIIDKTGNYSIEDRIVDIKYADLYIGVSSGLTWLSWVVGTPSIMISGCTIPTNEFSTNIERLFNNKLCNGCLNNDNITFDRGEWDWCPKHRNYECSTSITPEMVIERIDKILKI